jgi:hypothetical protein
MLIHYSLVLLAFSLFPTALGLTGPVANTSSGFYVGVHDEQNEVDIFKGIRFAFPSARFTPATPISKALNGPQTAVAFGDDCPQLPALQETAGLPAGPPLRGANQSEDCYFVNVSVILVLQPILLMFACFSGLASCRHFNNRKATHSGLHLRAYLFIDIRCHSFSLYFRVARTSRVPDPSGMVPV